MNDVASSTTNLLLLLFLTNTDTVWSFCGCDKRGSVHSYVYVRYSSFTKYLNTLLFMHAILTSTCSSPVTRALKRSLVIPAMLCSALLYIVRGEKTSMP